MPREGFSDPKTGEPISTDEAVRIAERTGLVMFTRLVTLEQFREEYPDPAPIPR